MELYSSHSVKDIVASAGEAVYSHFFVSARSLQWACIAPVGHVPSEFSLRSPEELLWRPAPASPAYADVRRGCLDERFEAATERPPYVGRLFIVTVDQLCIYAGEIELFSFGLDDGVPDVRFAVEPALPEPLWLQYGSTTQWTATINGRVFFVSGPEDFLKAWDSFSRLLLVDVEFKSYSRTFRMVINGDKAAILHEARRGEITDDVRATDFSPLEGGGPKTFVDFRGHDWDVTPQDVMGRNAAIEYALGCLQ